MGHGSLQVHIAVALSKHVVSRAKKLVSSNPTSCRHECPNQPSCNKAQSPDPPGLLPVSMSEPLLCARTLEQGGERGVPKLCGMPEPVHARTAQVPSSYAGMAKLSPLHECQVGRFSSARGSGVGLLSGDELFQDCSKGKCPNPCTRGTFGLAQISP